jgi:hypothetical protein
VSQNVYISEIKWLTLSFFSISATENGWKNGGLAYDWIQKDFDPQTQEKARTDTWVLIMDGHSSHYTADLLDFCILRCMATPTLHPCTARS